ncbi:NUDIX domain-containing protein [Rossellomorea sp. NPDC077527]|uniref:NUDIX domain-containing protein n=1 Tax=Rossellomorea sp. NPDC077527 TaxID=3364510 RepID=UPI0037C73CE0
MYIVNVEGAIHRNGYWLLIRRSEKEEHASGTLSLVGGKCELEGNSTNILERTLQREVFEEVGLKVNVISYVNSSSFVTDAGVYVIDIVFLCYPDSGEPFAKSPDEVEDVHWLSTDDILSHQDLPDYLKRNIELAHQKL